jgi:chitinase
MALCFVTVSRENMMFDYCCDGCQSQCDGGDGCGGGGGGGGGYLCDIIPESTFDALLKYRNDTRCPAAGFYTYDAFISAAKEFPDFGYTGDDLMRKREIAAFLGQTSHETTGRVLFFFIISCS